MLSEQPTLSTRGMVATAHYLATQAGLQMLTRGGNAIDAAIAANAAMTVVYPSMCSAGGDIFLLIWDAKSQKLHALNGSGRAPLGMTPALFAARDLSEIPLYGPLSINVPGAVDGWFTVMERFGSLSLETVLAPAITLAEDGMPVSPKLSDGLSTAAASVLGPWSSSTAIFLRGDRPLHTGEILRQPQLANTYKMLAREGHDAFYRGPLARSITDYVQQCGGVLSMEDMDHHRSDWVTPISTTYRGYEIYEFPPNSQGMTALEMLNILEGYDLTSLGYQTDSYLHLLLEAKKLAYADRDRYISDPDFVQVPVEQLLSKDYAAQLRSRIDPQHAAQHVESGLTRDGDTMYLCTADREGNVVSLIQSLYHSFGSGIVGGDTGVLLHNRGSYFSLDPRHVNYLQPGKRTMHTLSPAMVLRDGRPYMAIGTMGGDAQPQIHVQILSAMLDFGFNVQQAISAPRWHSGHFRLSSNEAPQAIRGQNTADLDPTITEAVILESRFSDEARLGLGRLEHHIFTHGPFEDSMGHAQAIVINPETGVFEGAADPRCDGLALGW
ncbi:MAG: gamma-glutamyltransferase [Ktedonobacteraceae bacterium]|nr:gamma-glutamyltransferase [Ktedonobacteraceae bacterium]